jgi:N-acetylneuraminate synthase
MEFTEEQWHGLKNHADDCGLLFLSSPFSIEAVEMLSRVGVEAWKIASGEVSNTPMFNRIIETGLPIILSTGMSPLDEIDIAVERIMKHNLPLTVLQCTSMYPTPPEKIGLNLIPFFRDRYGCQVGLSDHSGTVYAGLAAAMLGIDALEVHVIFSREMFGPDVPASITISELRMLVEGISFIETIRTHPVDKDAMARELVEMRRLFTKSIVARIDLPAGTVLKPSHLLGKKPGIGIPIERMSELIGRRLIRDIRADEFIKESDLE